MHTITATEAKQRFSEVMDQARVQPIAIQKHGTTVAVLVPPAFLSAQADRRLARATQAKVEADRLSRHQRIALRLLTEPAESKVLVEKARREVERWEIGKLCSRHYSERWRELLALPPRELAIRMCGDLEGWGTALRQNSPWVSVDDAG